MIRSACIFVIIKLSTLGPVLAEEITVPVVTVEAARVFEVPGECRIGTDLRVTGSKRAACVDKLETAARLAKAEHRVNEGRRKR